MGDTTVSTVEDPSKDFASPMPDGPHGPVAPGVHGAHDAYGAPHAASGYGVRTVLVRLRRPRRPRLWFEIALIAVSYWLYSLIRNAVPEERGQALRNAHGLWQAENSIGIGVEGTVNRAVNSVTWLIVGMNYYYATLHFVVTVCVLVWLYRRHPGRYAASRTVLFVTTASALLGYYLFPLAPPRLISHTAFVDTVLTHRTWGSLTSGDLKDVSNQYAAMPSMHIGWAVWCGLTVFALSRVRWARVLALLYPTLTLLVIVATANHFLLDAVGGLVCLACGYAVARGWYGSLPYALPRLVPVRSLPRAAAGVRHGPQPRAASQRDAGQVR